MRVGGWYNLQDLMWNKTEGERHIRKGGCISFLEFSSTQRKICLKIELINKYQKFESGRVILLRRSFDLDTKENLEMDIIPRHGRTQAGTGQRYYVSLKERVIVLRIFFESSRKKRKQKRSWRGGYHSSPFQVHNAGIQREKKAFKFLKKRK